ncbi:MAG: queuine tRNA-ribosyltransferase family protein [Acidobacteria bacterium]|nr:queuine tRNA-ribosyltransferase family protein [Acidobacteriota bacterium]
MNLENKALSFFRGEMRVPAFLPDATLGVVRSIDSLDLEMCGIQALVMNTFHLMQRPGSSTIKSLGGLHRMGGWERPIVTDSGGFQIYSLIRENPKYGSISEKGLSFQMEDSPRKFNLTPEKTIQLQVGYGSDVVICLDDCTHPNDPFELQEASVKRTISWARRCKKIFDQLMDQKKISENSRPLIFGVIQGGQSRDLRKFCANELMEIGFDGFGFGGWPLDTKGNLLTEIIGYTRELVPSHLPMHALGVGHPINVVASFYLGYDLFDSSLPTRDARNGRLYTLCHEWPFSPGEWKGDWFSYTYIADNKHIKTDGPIFSSCDCLCCLRYSVGYLHHLYKIKDGLFLRLATIHNLRFMTLLTEQLRESREKGRDE